MSSATGTSFWTSGFRTHKHLDFRTHNWYVYPHGIGHDLEVAGKCGGATRVETEVSGGWEVAFGAEGSPGLWDKCDEYVKQWKAIHGRKDG